MAGGANMHPSFFYQVSDYIHLVTAYTKRIPRKRQALITALPMCLELGFTVILFSFLSVYFSLFSNLTAQSKSVHSVGTTEFRKIQLHVTRWPAGHELWYQSA